MIETLSHFHFLRPWGLLFVIAGITLVPVWAWLGKRRDAVARMIAPHLLPHLSLPSDRHARFRPVHGVALLLVLAGSALSGPTWQRTLPPFADEQTRVTVIIDLSSSMDNKGTLAIAQDRIQTLADRHPGWYVGLISYGRTAHQVVPASRDRDLLALYLNSLEAGMIPGQGRNLAAALEMASETSGGQSAPQTLLLFTDRLSGLSAPPDSFNSRENLLVLAPPAALTDGSESGFRDLGANVRGFATSDEDLVWLEGQIQSHFNRQQSLDDSLKWRDMGYWLVWPALLVSLSTFRRGWRLGGGLASFLPWALAPLVLLATPGTPASAGELEDAFMTRDQQGRLAFESGDYAKAARTFNNPYLRGLSAYRAADYTAAIGSFRKLDTAKAWFYLGNSYARTVELEKAIIAYETALAKNPELASAKANLALVRQLASEVNEERAQAPDIGADEVSFDNDSGQGARTELQSQQSITADIWLQNLNTSATDFLKRKFAGEQRRLLGEQP